jgi:hypothetical protein
MATIARAMNIEWGGAWRTFKDRPHFEFHPGFGTGDARKLIGRYAAGILPLDFFAPGRTETA